MYQKTKVIALSVVIFVASFIFSKFYWFSGSIKPEAAKIYTSELYLLDLKLYRSDARAIRERDDWNERNRKILETLKQTRNTKE
jgi:hypothetical protein